MKVRKVPPPLLYASFVWISVLLAACTGAPDVPSEPQGDHGSTLPQVTPVDRAESPGDPNATAIDQFAFGDAAVLALGAGLPETEPGRAIAHHFDIMLAGGPAAEREYQASLARLQSISDDVVPLLDVYYRQRPVGDHEARWMAVQTLGALQNAATIPILADIAVAPFDALVQGDATSNFAHKGESTIRWRALSGLMALAREGDPAAAAGIESAIRHPDAGVRRMAVVACVELAKADESRLAYIAGMLDPSDRWMMEITSPDIRSLPQPPLPRLDEVADDAIPDDPSVPESH